MVQSAQSSGDRGRERPGFAQDAVVVSVAVVVTSVACVWEVVTPPTDPSHAWVASSAVVLLMALAAGLAWLLAGTRDLPTGHRVAWRLLSGSWTIVAAYHALELSVRAPGEWRPTVGWVTLLPTVAAPFIFRAMLALSTAARVGRDHLSAGLDAAIVVGTAWLVIWHFVVGPAVENGLASGGGGWMVIAALVGDLLVLAGAALVLLRCPRGPRRPVLLLLAASGVSMVVADVLRASVAWGVSSPAATDLPVLLAPVLFTLAAVLERRRLLEGRVGDEDLPLKPIASLPYIAIAVAYGVLVSAAAMPRPRGLLSLLAFGGALPVLLLVRHYLAARDNARLQRERTLFSSDARFKSLIQHASDVVTIIDDGWTITFASPSAVKMLGHRPSHLVGSSVLDLLHPDDVADASSRLRELLVDPTRGMCGRWRMRRSDQTYIDTDTVCVNLLADEHLRGIVLTARDVSEHRSLEAQLTHKAFHDQLTGLANRALLLDRVQHALARRRGGNLDTLGVVFVDLDHFKTINDQLGHATGDALLKAVAERLVRGLRAFDTAARIGGDEFAVLVDDTQRQGDVAQVADRITRAFREPFVFDGREVQTSASVGVALAAAGQTAEELLRNADLAMYLAKSRGRGQSAVFEPSMHAAAMTRQALQNDLRFALERRELSLVYLPIHALDSQALVGAEALLRWVHPTRGPIPPSTFVPIAEESGLMVGIGQWVLQRACCDAQRWREQNGGHPVRVAINLSGRQIPDGDLYEHVEQAVRESGLLPSAIVLEVTERILLQHSEQTLALLHRLRALGVRIAIDDFGTGVSSLSFLQRLPIDMLKIDRVFVDAIVDDVHAAQLTRAIVSLGESMSLRTVAEGIENAEQAERLRSLGCDYGQGYLFGMPMSAEALGDHAARNRALVGA